MAGHSSVFSLLKHSRNLLDEAIITIGETGGAVCPVGAGGVLSPEGKAHPKVYANQDVRVADFIGRDKVCFSTDLIHFALASMPSRCPTRILTRQSAM